jgi:gas vesicle protein
VRQYSDDNEGGSKGAFFTGLFAGAVIGAGLGLLFAPKKGDDIREQITDGAKEFSKRASRTVTDLNDRSREAFDRAREIVNTASDQLTQVASDAARAASAAARRGLEQVAAERR